MCFSENTAHFAALLHIMVPKGFVDGVEDPLFIPAPQRRDEVPLGPVPRQAVDHHFRWEMFDTGHNKITVFLQRKNGKRRCFIEQSQIGIFQYVEKLQFYAVYRSDNENSNVKALVNWLLSDEGQTLIAQSGYVKIK